MNLLGKVYTFFLLDKLLRLCSVHVIKQSKRTQGKIQRHVTLNTSEMISFVHSHGLSEFIDIAKFHSCERRAMTDYWSKGSWNVSLQDGIL